MCDVAFFENKLTATQLTAIHWQVAEPLYAYSTLIRQDIMIPRYFVTDGVSRPYLTKQLIDRFGTSFRAGVVHDFGYKYAGFLDKSGRFSACAKEVIDEVFLELMEALNEKEWRRNASYYGVRYFGGPVWKHHRKVGAIWLPNPSPQSTLE